MYLEKIRIENFRTFRHTKIDLLHPNMTATELRKSFPIPDVLYPNVNIVLGNNGAGKSAFLKAIALACLGPTVRDSGIFAYRLVRREPGLADVPREVLRSLKLPQQVAMSRSTALIRADFRPNTQDKVPPTTKGLVSRIRVDRRADLETIMFQDRPGKEWDEIYRDSVDAFFFVGYGATRRTEQRERVDMGSRRKARSVRASRVQGIFDEDVTLIPLSAWLPQFRHQNPGRYKQVVELLKAMTSGAYFSFTGELEKGEYLFEREGLLVPYPAMSDGYRAFFGWVGDLLYHVCMTAPSGKKLEENQGIVLIDEIDMHLHPRWQMEILPRLSKALPKVQFIATTHSPLIVGSLQWVNLITLEPGPGQSSELVRKEVPVHGLDSDQVLVSPYFDLGATRTGSKSDRLRDLRNRARAGDEEALALIMQELRTGSEGIADPNKYIPPPSKSVTKHKASTSRAIHHIMVPPRGAIYAGATKRGGSTTVTRASAKVKKAPVKPTTQRPAAKSKSVTQPSTKVKKAPAKPAPKRPAAKRAAGNRSKRK